ncbi:hypothetical protein SUGI_1158550 [Cryptomeria japonica]|nr:hypothetical protein SUGI_1158550 [Cryptomeria japonica]
MVEAENVLTEKNAMVEAENVLTEKNAMVEAENVLTEKNGGHQNIVARRNNKDDSNKVTPPNVKVPPKKLFGFPERYRSPTDSIMSPTTRGLLARNRKSVRPVELPTYLPRKSG